ncbi:undecaprenyl-phosphate glucose phosphotransferase [Alicyclobacillus mengziensis]|uniref:Undecaprenyl-phosphate glucose phosphotransferase n=1 Tax=Alicyclobacillus mengziensis TaxID=2931921 RepID=A0A9X7Z7N4_9BACL|nr:undecaprenyl-phosphate glucose phosphotransferase [Alicyclobacillus mengziensis]QSO47536.1 undecaprenyl-phosphate glucose phosphotransferase [Alicyclobacillus mengziensis]
MFRTYQVLWNRIYQLLDAVAVILSFAVSWYVKFRSGLLPFSSHESFAHYFPIILAAVPAFLCANWMLGLYKPMRSRSFWTLASALTRSLILGLLLFMSFLYFIHVSQFPRTVLALFGVFYTFLSYAKHVGIAFALRMLRRHGMNRKFVVIVGWSAAAQRFLENLEANPWFGYHVLGYCGDVEAGIHAPHLGDLSKFPEVLQAYLVDYVLICLPRGEVSRMPQVLSYCESVGVQSLIVPDYFDLLPSQPRFENFAGMPLIDTRYVPLDDAVNAFFKRTFDILFSLSVLILLSPIFLGISIGVKFSSPGPVLFRQERAGRNRRLFTMYKFRTMVHLDTPNDKSSDENWTVPNDPRCTGFGAFLRKTSLDELPQFWNVLIGDMSVIGPRPERPYFVEQFREAIPRYMVKHRVRPGITGWAQIHGWRGDTSIAKRIDYDLQYIENWTFGMDLRIIARTVLSGFGHKNAY